MMDSLENNKNAKESTREFQFTVVNTDTYFAC